MSAIIMALLKQKAMGSIVGLLASKTQYGASAATVTGLWAILPRALEGNPDAIGQAVIIVVGWLVALYGRLRAGR